jgi:hypothetical protein
MEESMEEIFGLHGTRPKLTDFDSDQEESIEVSQHCLKP